MNERTRPNADAAEEAWVAFEVGEFACALPLRAIREIVRAPTLTEVPGAPARVLGILVVAGVVVTVFELAACIAVDGRSADDRSRILLLHHRGELIGIRVCAVLGVLQLSRARRLPIDAGGTANSPPRRWLSGRAEHPEVPGGLWLLDEARLLQ